MTAALSPETLYLDYHEKVERYVKSRVAQQQDAEDLVSDIFVKACSHLGQYDPARAAPGTWLYAIARNVVVDYFRARGAQAECCGDQMLAWCADPDPLPEGRLLREETLDLLASGLSTLPARERDIIILRFFHGLTPAETAQRVGVSYANVRFLQHRALQKLRSFLQLHGFEQELAQTDER